MKTVIQNKKDFKTLEWSGGTTTELAIFPSDAVYKERNFLFRISTSTIEQETSVFTSLPGVTRQIMVLEGEMLLEHQGHHTKKLEKFDTDTFKGDWKTVSHGRCIDFNVMTTGNTKAFAECFFPEKGLITYPGEFDVAVIYVYKGKIVADNNETGEGSVLTFTAENAEERINFEATEKSELIIVRIKF